jgi:hypothetical protein
LWRSAGIHPAAVAGHGPGEVAAAQVADVLSPADAAQIAAFLGRQAAGAQPGPEDLTAIRPKPGTVPVFSTRDAMLVAGVDLDAGYWSRSPQDGPLWQDVVVALAADGFGVYVEVSPDPVLTDRIAQVLADKAPNGTGLTVTGTLRREEAGLWQFLSSLAAVHVRGTAVDWAAVLAGGHRVDLPTYAFQRQRYWPTIPVQQPVTTPPAADPASLGERQFWAAVDGGDVSALAGMLGLAGQLHEDMPLGAVLARLSSWREQERGRGRALLNEAPEIGDLASGADDQATAGSREWMRQLDGLTPAEQQELMRRLVREGIAAMLGYESLDLVPADGDVFEIGMTSMLAVQLRESITERTGVNLPEGFIYDFYSPDAIADFLWAELSASLLEGDSTAV